MTMRINIGSAIKRALQHVAANLEQTKSGLLLPPEYIAGRHFGGFGGYEPWVQDCIRVSCKAVRGVGPDELSELTSLAMWTGPSGNGEPRVDFFVEKHAVVMQHFERYAERIGDLVGRPVGLTEKVREQIRRVDGTRARGTLMVIALNPVEAESTGELKAATSAWNPASVEEAAAVPKQKYVLG